MAFERGFIDELRRDEIKRARAMAPEKKVLAGLELFELARDVMRDGIRSEHPEADEATIRRLLRERLALTRGTESRR